MMTFADSRTQNTVARHTGTFINVDSSSFWIRYLFLSLYAFDFFSRIRAKIYNYIYRMCTALAALFTFKGIIIVTVRWMRAFQFCCGHIKGNILCMLIEEILLVSFFKHEYCQEKSNYKRWWKVKEVSDELCWNLMWTGN